MWSGIRSRRSIVAPTCSSGGGGSWTTGQPIWSASAETRRPRRAAERPPPILERRPIRCREPLAARTMIALSPTLAHHVQRARNVSASVL